MLLKQNKIWIGGKYWEESIVPESYNNIENLKGVWNGNLDVPLFMVFIMRYELIKSENI